MGSSGPRAARCAYRLTSLLHFAKPRGCCLGLPWTSLDVAVALYKCNSVPCTRRVRQGSRGLGAGCAAPPPPPTPPTHPWCRGVTEGLGALVPRPRRGLPECPVGASAAPKPCEAPSPLPSSLPPSQGVGGAQPRCALWPLRGVTKQPAQQQFWGFRMPMARVT